MKKILIIVAAALMAVGCNKTYTYTVEGNIEGYNGIVTIVENSREATVLTTAEAVDGKFKLTVEAATPLLANLVLDNEQSANIFFDSENTLTVSGTMADENAPIVVTGSPANDANTDYMNTSMALFEAINFDDKENLDEAAVMGVFMQVQQVIEEKYEMYKNNLWGIYVFVQSKHNEMTPEEVIATIDGYDKYLQTLPVLDIVRKNAEAQLKLAVGKSYIDFAQPDRNGEEVALSSVIGEGKVVLLDFWASWCSPCMHEVPYLLEAYKNYHDKGFEIYGVSLDDNKEAWLGAIDKHQMQWVNVSTLTGWNNAAAQEYAVRSIPTNYLIDGEGNILAKNLRGEALEAKLAEIFQ